MAKHEILDTSKFQVGNWRTNIRMRRLTMRESISVPAPQSGSFNNVRDDAVTPEVDILVSGVRLPFSCVLPGCYNKRSRFIFSL